MKRSVTFAAALAATLAAPAFADGFTLTGPDIAEGQYIFIYRINCNCHHLSDRSLKRNLISIVKIRPLTT